MRYVINGLIVLLVIIFQPILALLFHLVKDKDDDYYNYFVFLQDVFEILFI